MKIFYQQQDSNYILSIIQPYKMVITTFLSVHHLTRLGGELAPSGGRTCPGPGQVRPFRPVNLECEQLSILLPEREIINATRNSNE